MKLLKQGDPRWSNVTIGNTKLKLSRFGCTITALSMLSDYFASLDGKYHDPAQLAKSLSFTQNGLLLWSSVRPMTTGFHFEWRQYDFNPEKIDVSLKDPKKAVLLEVMIPNVGKHWVVALRRIPLTQTYWIADPIDGKRKLSRVYGKPTGSAHFIL